MLRIEPPLLVVETRVSVLTDVMIRVEVVVNDSVDATVDVCRLSLYPVNDSPPPTAAMTNEAMRSRLPAFTSKAH